MSETLTPLQVVLADNYPPLAHTGRMSEKWANFRFNLSTYCPVRTGKIPPYPPYIFSIDPKSLQINSAPKSAGSPQVPSQQVEVDIFISVEEWKGLNVESRKIIINA